MGRSKQMEVKKISVKDFPTIFSVIHHPFIRKLVHTNIYCKHGDCVEEWMYNASHCMYFEEGEWLIALHRYSHYCHDYETKAMPIYDLLLTFPNSIDEIDSVVKLATTNLKELQCPELSYFF